MKILIDTGIFVSILNKEDGYEGAVRLLEKVRTKRVEGFISVMTIAEIISIYHRLGEEETIVAKASIESVLGEDRIVPVTKDIAELAGKVKAEYKISLGDALIIATGTVIGCEYVISLDPEMKQVDNKLIKSKNPSKSKQCISDIFPMVFTQPDA